MSIPSSTETITVIPKSDYCLLSNLDYIYRGVERLLKGPFTVNEKSFDHAKHVIPRE